MYNRERDYIDQMEAQARATRWKIGITIGFFAIMLMIGFAAVALSKLF